MEALNCYQHITYRMVAAHLAIFSESLDDLVITKIEYGSHTNDLTEDQVLTILCAEGYYVTINARIARLISPMIDDYINENGCYTLDLTSYQASMLSLLLERMYSPKEIMDGNMDYLPLGLYLRLHDRPETGYKFERWIQCRDSIALITLKDIISLREYLIADLCKIMNNDKTWTWLLPMLVCFYTIGHIELVIGLFSCDFFPISTEDEMAKYVMRYIELIKPTPELRKRLLATIRWRYTNEYLYHPERPIHINTEYSPDNVFSGEYRVRFSNVSKNISNVEDLRQACIDQNCYSSSRNKDRDFRSIAVNTKIQLRVNDRDIGISWTPGQEVQDMALYLTTHYRMYMYNYIYGENYSSLHPDDNVNCNKIHFKTNDVQMVVSQTGCDTSTALKQLKHHAGDLVYTIMDLSVNQSS